MRQSRGAYLVHTDPLQADVGCHGGSEVAQTLQPQHSSRQARSCRLAASKRSAPAVQHSSRQARSRRLAASKHSAHAAPTERVAWQRVSIPGILVLLKHNSCMADAAITLRSTGDTQHMHPDPQHRPCMPHAAITLCSTGDTQHDHPRGDAAITLRSTSETQHIPPRAGLPWGRTHPAQRSPRLRPCWHQRPSG